MTRSLMIMAAGTGGHIIPGLAVAREMRERGWRVSWLGTKTGMENTLVPKQDVPLDTIGFSGLRGKGLLHTLTGGFRLLVAMRECWRILGQRKPDAVLGMGGYVTVPGGLMASLRSIPLVIHNADAGMLLSNRFLAPIADRITFGFGSETSTKYGVRAYVTGNPVRSEIAALDPPVSRFATRSGPLRLLVVGGSLGAAILNRTVPAAIAMLDPEQRPRVVHQTGAKDAGTVRGAYAAAGIEAEVLPFIDDMPARYAAADAVVCRAGAITVSELAAAGVGSILVPFMASTTGHQQDNARFMEESGGAIHVPQPELTAGGLAQILRSLTREKLLAMATAARAQAQPDATERVAEICAEAAKT